MTKHQPFKEVEGSRPDFQEMNAQYSKTPDPSWKPGQGLNKMASAKDFEPSAAEWRAINPDDYAENKGQLYKLMISGITPRPIAFMSTEGPDGKDNLAPFSYFNVVSHDPPTVMVSIQGDPSKEGGLKDTASNVMRTKQFCCSIISEPFVEASNYTSIDAPYDTDEWALAGLTKRKSETVTPPHVAESAFSMECELLHNYELINDAGKKTNTVILGRVRRFHVKESVFDKDDDMKVVLERLKPVSRLGGITYGRTTNVLELPRPKWDEVKDTPEVQEVLKKGAKSV